MANETVAERYNREYLQLKDDRKVRTFDYKSQERREREFVDPATVAVDPNTGAVTGTATARHDNEPAGFDRAAFEAGLEYNPNA